MDVIKDMPNPNPNQDNLTQNVRKRKKDAVERRKDQQRQYYAKRKQNAKVFVEDLDEQLELKAYDLHLHPDDKDKRANMGIFMRYKVIRDRATSGDFMDMDY